MQGGKQPLFGVGVAVKGSLECCGLPRLRTKASWEGTSFPLLWRGGRGEGESSPLPHSENPTTLLTGSSKSF